MEIFIELKTNLEETKYSVRKIIVMLCVTYVQKDF